MKNARYNLHLLTPNVCLVIVVTTCSKFSVDERGKSQVLHVFQTWSCEEKWVVVWVCATPVYLPPPCALFPLHSCLPARAALKRFSIRQRRGRTLTEKRCPRTKKWRSCILGPAWRGRLSWSERRAWAATSCVAAW